jgi:FAD/FMN-containing dehydrogenase
VIDEELQHRLAAAVSPSGLTHKGNVVVPQNIDAVIDVVRICAQTGTPIRVSSGGAGVAELSPAGGVVLSLGKLKAVSVARGGLTLRAEAGATVDVVRNAAHRARLDTVGVPEQRDAGHIGALVARGELPRRTLCGIEAVLSNGDLVGAGGAVLKDVVGYDLPSVLLGSMGRLAIIVAVSLRLEPAEARTPVGQAPGAAASAGLLTGAFDPAGLLRARA